MSRQPSKQARREWLSFARGIMAGLRANEIKPNQYEIITIYGRLVITLAHGTEHSLTPCIFTCFDEHERAIGLCSQFSGKWNFHGFDGHGGDQDARTFDYFAMMVNNIARAILCTHV